MKSKLLSTLLVATGLLAGSAPLAAADAAPKAPRTITIQVGVNDATKFETTAITASPGEEIKVVLTNMGTLPKASMGHNWVLLKIGTDPQAFAVAAIAAAGTDYIPDSMKDQVIVHTKIIGGKESDSVTFKVPTTPGDYTFICSFTAHFMLGMKGTLTVK